MRRMDRVLMEHLDEPAMTLSYMDFYASLESNIRGLSGKFVDTVNTEAKTSNNMELFLFLLLRTI